MAGSEGFEIFNERALVAVRQFGAEEMSAILDEVRALAQGK